MSATLVSLSETGLVCHIDREVHPAAWHDALVFAVFLIIRFTRLVMVALAIPVQPFISVTIT